MLVTIIADDSNVGVDGEFRTVNLSALDPNIHAIHWDSVANEGEIEYKSPRLVVVGDTETLLREETITDFAPYQSFVDAWGAAAPPAPPPPPTKAEVIDATFKQDAMAGLLGEVADLKGVTDAQLIADIKTRQGA